MFARTKPSPCESIKLGGGGSVADLRGGARDARPPPGGPKFFQFHVVFGKIWQNRMLTPPPSSGKSWIRHWGLQTFFKDVAKTIWGGVEKNLLDVKKYLTCDAR